MCSLGSLDRSCRVQPASAFFSISSAADGRRRTREFTTEREVDSSRARQVLRQRAAMVPLDRRSIGVARRLARLGEAACERDGGGGKG